MTGTPSENDILRRLISRIEQWDSEMEYDAEDRASLADDILHEFNGPPITQPPVPHEAINHVRMRFHRTRLTKDLMVDMNDIGEILDYFSVLARSSAESSPAEPI